MKHIVILTLLCLFFITSTAQIDPELLRTTGSDTGRLKLNMDAVYERPFTQAGKLPVSLGGYV